MKKVVVSLDGSEESFAAVRWCCAHLEPGATVVAVCGIGEFGEFVISLPPFDEPSSEARIEECLRNQWTEPLRRAGLRCEPRLIHRRQGRALLELAETVQPDALIIGKPPHHIFSDLPGAGGLNKVIHHARCPVVLVPVLADDPRRRGPESGRSTASTSS